MPGDLAFFDEVESKHAIQVLRYGVGDEIHFTNGAGLSMRGTIENAGKGGFSVRIFESIQINKPLELHMLMAILKAGDRMEWACEKITELGVTQFTLFQSDFVGHEAESRGMDATDQGGNIQRGDGNGETHRR
ncbi:MAG: hypothetical protein RLZZ47_1128 [Bacteroidota bacterium]